MTKSELVAEIAAKCKNEKPHMKEFIGEVLETAFDIIKVTDKVTLREFGMFTRKIRAARTGRNPQTGDTIAIPAKVVLTFKASGH
jgi:DNA-binding protein HU-beta